MSSITDTAIAADAKPVETDKREAVPTVYSTSALVRRLITDHLRPHAGRLVLAAILMAVVAGTTAATAQLLDPAIIICSSRKMRAC